MNLEDKLAICKAWLEGKTLEISCKGENTWETMSHHAAISGMYLNFYTYDYRVKETPKKSIAYCYIGEDSGRLVWFTKLIDSKEFIWKRCPEFDMISKEEE